MPPDHGKSRPSAPDQGLSSSPNERTLSFLRQTVGRRFTMREIAGDASTRRFYRVRPVGRTRAPGYVLMVHPEPLGPAAPLFSNHRILKTIGAPVPRLVAKRGALGLVLVEDLGTRTLQQHLAGRPGAPRRSKGAASKRRARQARGALYRQACDLIVLLQTRGTRAIRPLDFAARNALDRDRFLFELDHFHRHYVRGLLRLAPDAGEEALLRDFYAYLARDCDRMRRVYCHRDFQSRNLMVASGRLRLIDFQDARMGPYTYDAASLLRDSSLDLEEEMVQEMIAYLAHRLGEVEEEFRRDFDRMALQRNLKDLGTFGYMATVRGRRDYLEYIPRTVASVRRALLRDRTFDVLHAALTRFILAEP